MEDHDDSRRVLAVVLERAGFKVTAYDCCAPAAKHLDGCDMDIALLDVRMEDRSGDDFARELRARCDRMTNSFIAREE